MHVAPLRRASAGEQADTAGVLWAMDRVTFRDIVLASRIDRRQLYEEILDTMEVDTLT